jgi:hypothetical protein
MSVAGAVAMTQHWTTSQDVELLHPRSIAHTMPLCFRMDHVGVRNEAAATATVAQDKIARARAVPMLSQRPDRRKNTSSHHK